MKSIGEVLLSIFLPEGRAATYGLKEMWSPPTYLVYYGSASPAWLNPFSWSLPARVYEPMNDNQNMAISQQDGQSLRLRTELIRTIIVPHRTYLEQGSLTPLHRLLSLSLLVSISWFHRTSTNLSGSFEAFWSSRSTILGLVYIVFYDIMSIGEGIPTIFKYLSIGSTRTRQSRCTGQAQNTLKNTAYMRLLNEGGRCTRELQNVKVEWCG